jgi:hypothetical protein
MRHAPSFVKIGCLISLIGACSNTGTGMNNTSQAGTPAPGTGTGGAGTTGMQSGGTAGRTTAPSAGTGARPAPSAGGTGGSTTQPAGGSGGPTAGSSTGAAGEAAPGTGGDFAMCGKPAKEGMCKAKAPGVYALKTEVDVWWRDENNSPTLYDPGRGKITVWFLGELSDICEDGSGGKALMKSCGTRLPPLYTEATCGIIQIVFPDALWDQPNIPKFMTTGSTSGFNPGDTLTVDPTAGLVGIELASVDAPFPPYTETTTFTCPSGAGEQCFPDQDGDGKPGVTVEIQQTGTPPAAPYPCAGEALLGPWKYGAAPFSVEAGLTGDGAKNVYIGLRTRLGGSGAIGADCMSGAGAATAMGFESRSFNCLTKDGAECTPAQSEFVDKNNPNYHVLQVGEMPPADWVHPTPAADAALDHTASKGPQSAVVRLGDLGQDFTCEQVRAAAFPANQ